MARDMVLSNSSLSRVIDRGAWIDRASALRHFAETDTLLSQPGPNYCSQTRSLTDNIGTTHAVFVMVSSRPGIMPERGVDQYVSRMGRSRRRGVIRGSTEIPRGNLVLIASQVNVSDRGKS